MNGSSAHAAPAVVGIREAAARLGVSVPTLRRWDKSAKLRATRNPQTGARVYRTEQLDAIAATGVDASPPLGTLGALVREGADELIGRARELSRLSDAIRDGVRTVSVVGAGGMGKTALARCFLENLRRANWAGRTIFCDLSEVEGPHVLSCITAALGIEIASTIPEDSRADFVGRRLGRLGPTVLVLDNVEHVMKAAVSLLRAWRPRTQHVTFLMTTRERLRLRDERVLDLRSLSPHDAVSLLLRSAERHHARVDASRHAETLARICQRLDGIPLALELAAARLGTFTPPELLQQLHAQLDVLASPHRDGVPRHATLRAAVVWSYNLLDSNERSLLASLSVFRGGFTAAAVQGLGTTGANIETLESLREKSLVHAVTSGSGEADAPRFDLYESIRELAAERLAAEHTIEREARDAHIAYFAGFAERALAAPPTDVAVDTLTTERDNILAALGRSGAHSEPTTLLLAIAADYACGASVPISERLQLLDQAMRGHRRIPASLLARAYATRGRLMLERNVARPGIRELTHAIALARRAHDASLEEYVLGLMALARIESGSRKEARLALARAERAASNGPDNPSRCLTWAALGSFQHEMNALDAAERCYSRALALARGGGQAILAARILARLGRVCCDAGRLIDAEDALESALPVLRGDRFEAWANAHWAILRWRQWRLDDARQSYERAVRLFATRGAVGFELLHRAFLAAILAALGRSIDAVAEIESARADAQRVRDRVFDAAVVLADAHRALLDGRRRMIDAAGRTRTFAIVGTAMRRTHSIGERDKDIRALTERLSATATRNDLPTRPTLVVAVDGAWMTAPRAQRVELPLGSPLRLFLQRLVAGRQTTPGHAVTRDELVGAAWPAERILARAATQRVYAAISELRAGGLGDRLERVADGYRIAPSLPLRIEGDHG